MCLRSNFSKKIKLIILLNIFFFISVNCFGDENKSLELEEITVTAQKKEEKIQDVPISLTVFNEQDIEDKNIESVKDIAPFTSNLMYFDNSGAGNFTTIIRGIQSSGTSLASSAGLFIDGIPILIPRGMDEKLMDIERIEVLKGPQGTLYGKDTEAGAINIITKKPDNEFRGKLGLEIGSDNKRQYSLSASGPIIKDKFYIGISGQHYEKDGLLKNTYLDKTVDDQDNNYGKLTLRWTPLDALDIFLISTKSKVDEGRFHVNDISATDTVIHTDLNEYCETESFMNALKIEYNYDSYKLSSITT
jgi:iron complex outermembrane receptor protein